MSGHPEPASRPRTDREHFAERIAARLDVPLTVAGVLFVLVVVADRSTPPGTALAVGWTVASWLLWCLFALELVLRAMIAPSTWTFLRHNWWQVLFLAAPFLRFTRAFSRSARIARGLSTSIRGTRTAARNLGGRLGWLTSITLGVVIGATEVLFELDGTASYPTTLHAVSLATVSGEPLALDGTAARVIELLLALYATVVFAALAGALGAFFLERRAQFGSPRADAT